MHTVLSNKSKTLEIEKHKTTQYNHTPIKLPPEIRAAAQTLGFTKKLWDNDKEPKECDEYWRDLSDDQRKAAELLGYDQKGWDSS